MKINWDNLNCFIALVEEGSLTAAAKRADISQPTAGRRIKELEKSIDNPLVKRLRDGIELTTAGKAVYQLAKEMQEKVYAIERRFTGLNEELAGRVSLACTDCIATSWIVTRLNEFRAQYPAIQIDINTGISLLSLLQRESDIALRIGRRGAEELVGERIGAINFGLYASAQYLSERGIPLQMADLAEHVVIESLGDIADVPQVRALREVTNGQSARVGFDSIMAQTNAMASGVGIVALPNYLATNNHSHTNHSQIRRVLHTEFDLNLDFWLLIHREMTVIARYNAVYEFLLSHLKRPGAFFEEP